MKQKLLVITYNKKAETVWQIIDRTGKVLHDNLSREEGLKLIKELDNEQDKEQDLSENKAD